MGRYFANGPRFPTVAVIRKLAIPALALAMLLSPSAAAGRLPPEFVGISPQTASNKADFALMELAGLLSVRMPMFWMNIERHSPWVVEPDWSDFDRNVTLAAEHGLRVFPFVWGTPSWIAREPRTEPIYREWTGRAR